MADVIKLGGVNGNQPDPIRVDLYEKEFTLRKVTRSVQRELDRVQKAINSLSEADDADTVVGLFGEGMDALLAPVQHRTPAKKLIVAKWEADELGLGELNQFFYELQEKAAAERPL